MGDHCAISSTETTTRETLRRRRLDAAQSLHRFIRCAQQIFIRLERVATAALDAFAKFAKHRANDRRDDDRDNGESPIKPHGRNKRRDSLGQLRECFARERNEAAFKFGGVTRHARNDFSWPASQHHRQRKPQRMAICTQPNLTHRHHRQRERAVLMEEIRDGTKDREREQRTENRGDAEETINWKRGHQCIGHIACNRRVFAQPFHHDAVEIYTRFTTHEDFEQRTDGDQSRRKSACAHNRKDNCANRELSSLEHASCKVPKDSVLHSRVIPLSVPYCLKARHSAAQPQSEVDRVQSKTTANSC